MFEIIINGSLPELKTHSKLKKESNQRVLEMHYKFDTFSVLSSDGKLEFYSVLLDE